MNSQSACPTTKGLFVPQQPLASACRIVAGLRQACGRQHHLRREKQHIENSSTWKQVDGASEREQLVLV